MRVVRSLSKSVRTLHGHGRHQTKSVSDVREPAAIEPGVRLVVFRFSVAGGVPGLPPRTPAEEHARQHADRHASRGQVRSRRFVVLRRLHFADVTRI